MTLFRSRMPNLLAAVMMTAVWSAAYAGLDRPAFEERPFYNVQAGSISAIETHSGLDVVFFSGGARAGYRTGMVCEVVEDDAAVGELLLVDVSLRHGAALIINLQPNQSLQAGQQVRIKTRPAGAISRQV